jgi:hypothetical protein
MIGDEELLDELYEWELMLTELQRANTEDWEEEHGRSKVSEIHWVLGNIREVRRVLNEAQRNGD